MKTLRVPISYFISSTSWEKALSGLLNKTRPFLKNWTPLKEYIKEINPRSPSINPEKSYHYVDLSSVNRKLGIIEKSESIEGSQLPSRAKRMLRKGDILIVTVNPGDKGVVYVHSRYDGSIGSNGLAVIKPEVIKPEYLFFCLRLPEVLQQMKEKCANKPISALSLKDINQIMIPEIGNDLRDEIIAECSKYFSLIESKKSLSEALEEVFPVPDAADGRNIFFIEFKKLCDQQRWDVKFLKGGTELGEGFVTLEDIVLECKVGYTLSKKSDKIVDYPAGEDYFPLLSSKQIGHGDISPDFDKYVKLEDKDKRKHLLPENTVVLVRVGTDIGRAALVKDNKKYLVNQHLITVKGDKDLLHPEYLVYFLNSPLARKQLEFLSGGTTIAHLGKKEFLKLQVPLPDLNKQQMVIQQIKQETNEGEVNAQLNKLAKLEEKVVKNYREKV